MKRKFNPSDWLPEKKAGEAVQSAKGTAGKTGFPGGENAAAVEAALTAIEAQGVDITAGYQVWLTLGFALEDEFGEAGRSYFHRVSRFHPEYSEKECDKQYTYCLKSTGQGIKIASFFFHVQQHGISFRTQKTSGLEEKPVAEEASQVTEPIGDRRVKPPTESSAESVPDPDPEMEEDLKEEPMPNFPEELFPQLPEFLQEVVAPASSPEERDLLLLGAVSALSSCFPKFWGIYDDMLVYPNLFLFVTAPPSAGKGRLSLCKNLVLPVHEKLREEGVLLRRQYQSELSAYNQGEGSQRDKPGKPPERMLILPGNNSSTGMFQLLHDNGGRGLIFETEGDTISQAFKSDYGNYSDGFRKAFHHETIAYYRRTDRENVEIPQPCLSAVLSGTPKQIPALIPSVENGLFSRFMFYYMNLRPVWRKVFRKQQGEGLQAHFNTLGLEFFELYKTLNSAGKIQVILNEEQADRFDAFFEQQQVLYLQLLPEEFVANIRRLGLIAFRMMMVLSGLRIMEDGNVSTVRECDQRDFESVLAMISVLIKHSSRVFKFLPQEGSLRPLQKNAADFYDKLPLSFNRAQHVAVAAQMGLSASVADKTISKLITEGFVIKDKYNSFRKKE